MPDSQHRHKSVFGEIIDWTLAPLLILWPISMAIQYFFAYSIANNAYDRELRDSVVAVSKQVTWDKGRLAIDLHAAEAAILRAEEEDQTFFQVRDQRNEIVGGDRAIPLVDFQPELMPQRVYFRDDYVPGHELRVAYVFAQVPGMPGAVLVQVAETVQKRSRLASEIIGDVLAAQFLIVPIALLFVWLGLTRGIEPLHELTQAMRRRKPSDLSPLDERDVPEEVRPLIRSFNELIARLDASLQAQQRFVADAAHQMRTPLARPEDAGGDRAPPTRLREHPSRDAADRHERRPRLAPHQPAARARARGQRCAGAACAARLRRARARDDARVGAARAGRRRSISASRPPPGRRGSKRTLCCCARR